MPSAAAKAGIEAMTKSVYKCTFICRGRNSYTDIYGVCFSWEQSLQPAAKIIRILGGTVGEVVD